MWEWLFCFLCACLPSATTLEWSEQQDFAKKSCAIHFFTLNFECLNRHKKLLLSNFENDDIAWCYINNSELGFVFFLNEIQPVSSQQTKIIGGLFHFLNGFFSTLAQTNVVFYVWFQVEASACNTVCVEIRQQVSANDNESQLHIFSKMQLQ